MEFIELKKIINEVSENSQFQDASDELQNIIYNLSKEELLPLVVEIGAIPEDIPHDSSIEKLYSKISDIILAKCFIELGFKATVLRERANCADVLVRSQYHNYSLVGDAKSFRLSRTAKNQKDFKVESMVHWKCDNDYSVLCCPYFQYPKSKSQIYGQAINGNVSLFSWEYFNLLLKNNIKETHEKSLACLWNFSNQLSLITPVSEMNSCFLSKQNDFIIKMLNCEKRDFCSYFNEFKEKIIERGYKEIEYWENEKLLINNLSREEAIGLLLKSLKLNEKINSINTYIHNLRSKNAC